MLNGLMTPMFVTSRMAQQVACHLIVGLTWYLVAMSQ
jgi:hypothetical protein